jgi:hypothetical protein
VILGAGLASPSRRGSRYPVKITGINDVIVEFDGSQEFFAGSQLVDRI